MLEEGSSPALVEVYNTVGESDDDSEHRGLSSVEGSLLITLKIDPVRLAIRLGLTYGAYTYSGTRPASIRIAYERSIS